MADSHAYTCTLEANVTTREDAHALLIDGGDRFVIQVVYPCIMALGILTNGAFCIVMCRISRMRTITNLYLVNLAMADLVFLVMAVSEKLALIAASPVYSDKTLFGVEGCILTQFILNCTYFASIFIVTLVSVEKFYAICRPLQHRRFSDAGRTVRLLICAWILSLLLSCFFIPGRARLDVYCVQWPADLRNDLPPVISYCRPIEIWSWFQHVANFLQTVPFFVAMIINTALYARILKTMNMRVAAQGQLGQVNNNRAGQVRNQVARMLVANGVIFFLCQVLFQAVSVALAFRHLRAEAILTNEQIDKVLIVARILSYLNSAVNSIIYNIFSSRYRHAFRETFCRWKDRRVRPGVRMGLIENQVDPIRLREIEPMSSGQNKSTNSSTRTHSTFC